MDQLTFRLWDTDVENAEYSGVFEGHSEHLLDGKATGAWMCGYHLNQLFSSDEFRDNCTEWANKFVDAIEADMGEPLKPSIGPATCYIYLRDVDIDTGAFEFEVDMEGHDETGYHMPTAAQLACLYCANLITTKKFATDCMATARSIVNNIEGAYIANDPDLRATIQ